MFNLRPVGHMPRLNEACAIQPECDMPESLGKVGIMFQAEEIAGVKGLRQGET